MNNHFSTLQPYFVEALINEEDKKLIRENIRHNTLVLVLLSGLSVVFLIIVLGMLLSDDQSLKGIPVALVGIFFFGTLSFFAYYMKVRRKWKAFFFEGHKFIWNIKLDKVKKKNRRSDSDSRSTRWKIFDFQGKEYEISEDDIGFVQFQKIQEGVDLEFSFTPFYVPYRVEVL